MSVGVVGTAHDFRRACQEARTDGELALVPTMGYLHGGHQSLILAAARRAPTVAVTIFVNPTQFGPAEDLSRYPRDIEGDLRKCEQAGATFVFAPKGPEEMYPPGFQTWVEPGPLAAPLEGEKRPGHFRGVCTVVAKLFALSRTECAFRRERGGNCRRRTRVASRNGLRRRRHSLLRRRSAPLVSRFSPSGADVLSRGRASGRRA